MNNKYVRILSIDGGGIRGIVPGWILVALESKLQEKSNNKDARLSDYFDLICGTSTGGILSCAYLSPDIIHNKPLPYSADFVANLYQEYGPEILKHHFLRYGIFKEKYNTTGLELVLSKFFAKEELKNLKKPCLITSYDIERQKGHFFRQHKAEVDPYYNFKLTDVARATSAAPTYFPTETARSDMDVSFSLIDGGVFVNNPALCGYSEAREIFRRKHQKANVTAKDIVLFSLGTSSSKKPINNDKAEHWGAIKWAVPLISVMMSGVADTVDYQLRQIFDSVKVNDQYIRINHELPETIDGGMDNTDKENMQKLKEFGVQLGHEHSDDLDKLVDLLMEESHDPPILVSDHSKTLFDKIPLN